MSRRKPAQAGLFAGTAQAALELTRAAWSLASSTGRIFIPAHTRKRPKKRKAKR
ncbi:MAG: hypothetical protein KDA24_24690 [Deltaproteobacteria bacterium]|nr:hypothetical protein [Deltaproteobacteria bacterium]